MNVLVSLVPLVLIVWSGQHAVALPVEDRLALQTSGGLAKERRDFLLKMLSGLSELNLLEKEAQDSDTESLLQAKLGERSVFSQSAPRERSPCKNFFWKTFSSC
ncbi:somatostatin 6 [Megalops cyprinoides]|uniref:somatostatin 6 n=1 Tax=Megalops cyprinoides TaxID=118141 RepID=UPI00186482EE|nr:somatostatin 6 [Megalops cyprinoides]